MAGFFAFRGKNGRKTLVLIWSFFVQQRKFALTKRRDLNQGTRGRRKEKINKRCRISNVNYCNSSKTVVHFYLKNIANGGSHANTWKDKENYRFAVSVGP